MKVLCLELCNYVQLNEVMSTETVCPSCLFTREHPDPLRQYRVGCVVLHEQVMPESCYYLSELLAHSHPCLVSLLFILSLFFHIFEFGEFFIYLSPFFFSAQLCSGLSTKVYKVLW